MESKRPERRRWRDCRSDQKLGGWGTLKHSLGEARAAGAPIHSVVMATSSTRPEPPWTMTSRTRPTPDA